MKVHVIIAAAGSGTRMGSGINKQFMRIGGGMVIERSLRRFSAHPMIDHIYLAVREEDFPLCREARFQERFPKLAAIVAGGASRQDTVWNALTAMAEGDRPGVVLVHDGARPFVSEDAVTRLIHEAVRSRAAVLGVPVKDTIKRIADGIVEETPDRNELFSIQTPQGFAFDLLLSAYVRARQEGFTGTDDASLVEQMGEKVSLAAGEYGNIKITTKEDLPMETLWRCGTGFDVHAFAPDRKLVLGGVAIPFDRGLLGHSDADVLTHAVMDALLGAAGLGDIGRHFPDSSAAYKDISSIVLLSRVRDLIREAGYEIGNIDATVIAEKPKIAPYIEEMRGNLAKALTTEPIKINIKGTTTEKLGFSGREEGIAAMASCMLSGAGAEVR